MKRIAFIFILVFGISGAAYAEVLFSPPLFAVFATNSVVCSIVNADDTTRDVVIEVLNPGGGVIRTSGVIPLAPGNVASTEAPGNLTPITCKFKVQGPAKMFRASIVVIHPDLGIISALPVERPDGGLHPWW